jgi:phosphoribosylglycinamide formyltransferase-1
MRLGVLVSGRGTNLGAILDAVAAGELAGVEPVIVISNRGGVRALEVASAHGVPTRVIPRSAYADLDRRDAAIGRALAAAGTQLAVLAGYDQRLRQGYFAAFGGRTINIHPSLLPRHGGPGMMGSAVHEAVLAAGDRETGVTIHEVTLELDAGPTLRQVRVPVLAADSPDRLAERVLAVEHRTLVALLRELAGGPGAAATDRESSASMTGAPATRTSSGAEAR